MTAPVCHARQEGGGGQGSLSPRSNLEGSMSTPMTREAPAALAPSATCHRGHAQERASKQELSCLGPLGHLTGHAKEAGYAGESPMGMGTSGRCMQHTQAKPSMGYSSVSQPLVPAPAGKARALSPQAPLCPVRRWPRYSRAPPWPHSTPLPSLATMIQGKAEAEQGVSETQLGCSLRSQDSLSS